MAILLNERNIEHLLNFYCVIIAIAAFNCLSHAYTLSLAHKYARRTMYEWHVHRRKRETNVFWLIPLNTFNAHRTQLYFSYRKPNREVHAWHARQRRGYSNWITTCAKYAIYALRSPRLPLHHSICLNDICSSVLVCLAHAISTTIRMICRQPVRMQSLMVYTIESIRFQLKWKNRFV